MQQRRRDRSRPARRLLLVVHGGRLLDAGRDACSPRHAGAWIDAGRRVVFERCAPLVNAAVERFRRASATKVR
jgi:hypothetical protein